MKNAKEVTIYDIAEALNISPATVSRGLKDHPHIGKDTKKRIVEAARKMGYRHNTFASSLRRKSTNAIGVLVPRLNSYFMAAVLAGMEKAANNSGYSLIISQSLESYKKEITSANTMFNSHIDGLLVSLASDTKDIDHFDTFLKKQIPLVFFDRVINHPQCTSVLIDNKKAGYDATLHLLDQGCKRISHICGNLNRNVYSDRLDGYKLALAERGISFDQSLVFENNLTDQAGAEAAQSILKMDSLPDGLFTANDISAVACIREFKKAGIKVPEQIAVVGFNNDPISNVIEPNLTTINYPGNEIGEVATNTLISKLKKELISNLDTIVLRHNLIIRESSVKKVS